MSKLQKSQVECFVLFDVKVKDCKNPVQWKFIFFNRLAVQIYICTHVVKEFKLEG